MSEKVKAPESTKLSTIEKYIIEWKQNEMRESLRICNIALSDECRVTLENDKDAIFTYRELIDEQGSVERVTGLKIHLEHVLRRNNEKKFKENTVKISGEWYFIVQKNGRAEILTSTISDGKNDGIKFLANTPEDLSTFMHGVRQQYWTTVPGITQHIESRLQKNQLIDEKDFLDFLETARKDLKKADPKFNNRRANIQGWDDENEKFEYIENIVKKADAIEEATAKIPAQLLVELDEGESLAAHRDPISGGFPIIEVIDENTFETTIFAHGENGMPLTLTSDSEQHLNELLETIFSKGGLWFNNSEFKDCNIEALKVRVENAQKLFELGVTTIPEETSNL